MSEWSVYVLVSESIERTYVGISTDVPRRLDQHNGELPGGARATRSGRPWRLGAMCGPIATRGRALQIEHQIKSVTGQQRLALARELGDDESV